MLAYWLIGREIVQELQGGAERAEYGKKVLDELSVRLTERYGKGFSEQSLQNFRRFYLAYAARVAILSPPGRESNGVLVDLGGVCPQGDERPDAPISSPPGRKLASSTKRHPSGAESLQGFSPHLTWSHYRALMRVDDAEAREFYEREAVECGWSKAQLERQIHSFYYNRIVANRGKKGLSPVRRKRLPGERLEASDVLKSPMVLEFLGLPDSRELHESKIEQAIIDNLQSFFWNSARGFPLLPVNSTFDSATISTSIWSSTTIA